MVSVRRREMEVTSAHPGNADRSTAAAELQNGQCKFVEKIKLEKCLYLDDSALNQLHHLKSSLHSLSIIKCYAISKKGLLSLAKLENLKQLQLSGLKSIEQEELDSCINELSKHLPLCEIKSSQQIAKEVYEERKNNQ